MSSASGDRWSPIHLLSIFTPATLPVGVLVRAAAPRERPPLRHDLDLLRRAADRRTIHVRTRPHHARGGVRKLSRNRPGFRPSDRLEIARELAVSLPS